MSSHGVSGGCESGESKRGVERSGRGDSRALACLDLGWAEGCEGRSAAACVRVGGLKAGTTSLRRS